MSVYSQCQALSITGITPHEKLLLLIMTAEGLDPDGCYPKHGLASLKDTSLLTQRDFDRALARMYARGLMVDAVSEGEDSVKVVDWSVQNITGQLT